MASLPPGWTERDKRLHASYKFPDFARAMAFVNEVALRAEAREHHPDLHIHYNQVRFEVWSHDAGRVTKRDRALVKEIAKAAKAQGAKRGDGTW